MKRTYTIAVAILMTASVWAQSPEKVVEKSRINNRPQITTKTKLEKPVKANLKTQLIGEWRFHEITLRTPKDGYLIHIAAQETNIIKLMIANYTFNIDGSIALDPKYIEKQGVKEAKWNLSDSGKLTIVYFWTPEKMKEFGLPESQNKEELDYKVNLIPGKELTLNMSDMFIVNLISKSK